MPAAWVFPLPDGVDLVEAAAMPVAFLTAWYALARAEVGSGDRVVVTAAAGGVGTALLQLISLRGARALALVGSESKLALCRELGAVDAGLYASSDDLLARHFNGHADVVIDAIGGRLFRVTLAPPRPRRPLRPLRLRRGSRPGRRRPPQSRPGAHSPWASSPLTPSSRPAEP